MTLAFWSICALLAGGALLFVVPALHGRTPARAGPSLLAVYREQRAEADAELAAGTMTVDQHGRALDELATRVAQELGEARPAPEHRSSRRATLAASLALALLLPAGALGVYVLLGTPAALDSAARGDSADAPHAMTPEQMTDMVEQLAARLQRQPDDAAGWHMLARSYVTLNRLPQAAQAYDRANALVPGDPTVLADYADVLAVLGGRKLEGRPRELVEAALAADPSHPKALSLAGTAAFDRGDFTGAVQYWDRLRAALPAGSPQARSVAASLAQAQVAAGKVPRPASETDRPQTGAPAGAQAVIEGSVTIAERLRDRVAPGTTLFVFARSQQGARMPLAIMRVPTGTLPAPFHLDDSQAMAPQFRLSGHRQVVLGARISRSGNAKPEPGDLSGTLAAVKVGARGVRIVIDEVLP